MQTETLSIRISKEELAALRRRARRERVSQGALVRRALRSHGVTPQPVAPRAKSGYDVIKHLIGKMHSGLGDLSTNPKYMEGFGR